MTSVTLAYDGPRVDAHLHVWERAASDYSWLRPGNELYADFPPAKAAVELAGSGFGHAVLVQADDTARDTRFLLEAAEQNEWVSGVVGWVPLNDPAAAIGHLDEFADRPALRGIREMIHVKGDRDYLARPAVLQSLAAVAGHNLAVDIPDAWPHHLHAVPALADALPHLTIVIDHLAKPPVAPEEFATWRAQLLECALRPNVVTKFSGLSGYAKSEGLPATRAVLALALDAFGAHRMCWGSDWPISTKFDGYSAVWATAAALIAELSASEQRDILFATAARAYGLEEG
ncbi:MAG: hydrolase [Glaciihabitans sp.]|nr:hydrolase [Glaciihabitans sp.]